MLLEFYSIFSLLHDKICESYYFNTKNWALFVAHLVKFSFWWKSTSPSIPTNSSPAVFCRTNQNSANFLSPTNKSTTDFSLSASRISADCSFPVIKRRESAESNPNPTFFHYSTSWDIFRQVKLSRTIYFLGNYSANVITNNTEYLNTIREKMEHFKDFSASRLADVFFHNQPLQPLHQC